jgi:aromatic-L-amino-acid/L-tryptophan decarboxylase
LFYDLLSTSSIFEVVTPRSLALTVFRLIIPDADVDASSPPPASLARPIDLQILNELNMEFHHRLTEGSGPGGEDDKLFLTRTDLNGTVCIRLVVGAERTQEEHVQRAFDILCKVGRMLLNDFTPHP